jgi:hypothetical protein
VERLMVVLEVYPDPLRNLITRGALGNDSEI